MRCFLRICILALFTFSWSCSWNFPSKQHCHNVESHCDNVAFAGILESPLFKLSLLNALLYHETQFALEAIDRFPPLQVQLYFLLEWALTRFSYAASFTATEKHSLTVQILFQLHWKVLQFWENTINSTPKVQKYGSICHWAEVSGLNEGSSFTKAISQSGDNDRLYHLRRLTQIHWNFAIKTNYGTAKLWSYLRLFLCKTSLGTDFGGLNSEVVLRWGPIVQHVVSILKDQTEIRPCKQ